MVKAAQRRAIVNHLTAQYAVSARRACGLARISASAYYYRAKSDPQSALRLRIRDLARSRVRYGYKRIHVLLKREGIHVNKKRVHRLYCQEGLQLRPRRPRRNVSAARRQRPRIEARAPNAAWAMDFVSDQLQDGRRFRALTVVDIFTRENLVIQVGRRLGGEDVAQALQRIARRRGLPQRIYCDNGAEFAGRLVDLWAYANHVILEFSRPGKPTDNAFIESFNGSLRDECLNTHWFTSLTDAQETLDAWRRDYNGSRPHKALDGLTPLEYAGKWAAEKAETL